MNMRQAAVGLCWAACSAFAFGPADSFAEEKAPGSVAQLWAGYDPRAEPLDAKTVRTREKDGVVHRVVTFHVGTFKGKPARMAAFYAFPKGAGAGEKLPGLLHLHGGGQRAFLHEVEFYAKRGYACLSINWGGREMEEAQPGDPGTDWGAVDPTQKNVPGYFTLRPGPGTLDAFESPRNNNWYLLTIAARRGLTFLEQQPEVDRGRLGVYGHSMGGNLTVYTAGVDDRVRAAAPSVGGSGFRTQRRTMLEAYIPNLPDGDLDLFRRTLEFEAYAPRIRAPLLWLGSTNDFHGVMDDTYRTGELVPHGKTRYTFTPHMDHRFTPEFEVARPLWFDHFFKGGVALPKTPPSELVLAEGRDPELKVVPDDALPVESVRVYYSLDPDPRARFWRSADAVREGNAWRAPLPISAAETPLFAFANVHYRLPQPTSSPSSRSVEGVALSSLLHIARPQDLKQAAVAATDAPTAVIEDFARGWRDWYQLSPENPHHWEYATRKLSDTKYRGADDRRLTLGVQADKKNTLLVVLTENVFRSYRGKQREFAAVVDLAGGDAPQTLSFAPGDFKAADGTALSSWRHVDLLRLRAYLEQGERLLGSKSWAGPQPKFILLRWDAPAP